MGFRKSICFFAGAIAFAAIIGFSSLATVLIVTPAAADPADDKKRCSDASGDVAIDACTRAIASDSFNSSDLSRLYDNRGFEYAKNGQFDYAIHDYDLAIRHNPNNAFAFNNRGNAYYKKDQHGLAIADYNEAIRLDPKYKRSYFNRGFAWRNQDDDRAIADFNEAIKLDPTYAIVYYFRATAYEKKKELQRALADFQRFVELTPSDPDGPKSVARVTAALGPGVARSSSQQLQSSAQLTSTVASSASRRVALLIGNSKYQHASPLKNPTNDVQAIATSLRTAGFQSVTVKTELKREEIISALRDFATVADAADWSMVYYSGHGVEFGGVNYMIPIDARLLVDRDIDLETVDVGKVLSSIEGSKILRLVVLDACRDNPFVSQMRRTMSTRSMGRGLARIEPEAGTLVVYAAKHGETALDGDGLNSPFATALKNRIATPNLEIRRLFDLVRDDVMSVTSKKQQPFSYGSLSGSEDYYFVKR